MAQLLASTGLWQASFETFLHEVLSFLGRPSLDGPVEPGVLTQAQTFFLSSYRKETPIFSSTEAMREEPPTVEGFGAAGAGGSWQKMFRPSAGHQASHIEDREEAALHTEGLEGGGAPCAS